MAPTPVAAADEATGATGAIAVTPTDPIVLEDSTFGRSVEGRPLEAIVRGATDGPCVLLLATIHGDEAAGTPLLLRMAAELSTDPARANGRRVLLIPIMNPDGLAAGVRGNARGVDLNRNFPATNFTPGRPGTSGARGRHHGAAPLSEPESRALHELIDRERPERVVSIHMPTAQVDWDGPAETLARRMAELSPLPARRMGSRPGSLGSYVGIDLGVPILTLELAPADRRRGDDELWDRYGEALLSVLE